MRKRRTFSEFTTVIARRAQDISPPGSPLSPKAVTTTEEAVDQDESTHQGWFLLRPHSTVRILWNLLTLGLIVYQAVFVPLYLGFMLPLSGCVRVVEVTVTFVLCGNLAVGFNTGFYRRGVLVSQRSEVAKHYVKKRLVMDFVAFFPFDLLVGDRLVRDEEMGMDPKTDCMKLERLLMVTRMLGLCKAPMILKSLEDIASSSFLANTLTLGKKVVVILLIGHFISCFWFFTAEMQGSWTQLTWTIRMRRERHSEPSLSDFYIQSVYWTYTVMLTVGFGDIVPQSTAERLYATLCMLVACCVFAYLLGSIGTIVQKQSLSDDLYRDRMIAMNAFMKNKYFPDSLKYRVRQYLKTAHNHLRAQQVDDNKIFDLLSDPLKDEVSAHIHGSAVVSYPLFRKLSQKAVAMTGRILKDELFAEGDLLFAERTHGEKMYYIERGEVNIVHLRTHTLFRTLKEGQYFGQIGFFLHHARCASAQCVHFVHVLSLDRDSLREKHSEELDSIVSLVEAKCASGDLTYLRIRCYLCGGMGHVALACKQEVVNAGGEVVRSQWLSKRMRAHSVNPLTCKPNFSRKSRKVRERRYSMPTVSLKEKIEAFAGRRNSSQSKVSLPSSSIVQSSIRTQRPNWSDYFDSDPDEANSVDCTSLRSQ